MSVGSCNTLFLLSESVPERQVTSRNIVWPVCFLEFGSFTSFHESSLIEVFTDRGERA